MGFQSKCQDLKDNLFHNAQACRPWGRSVNPISTRGDRLCPRITIGTPGFSDLPTALQCTEVRNDHLFSIGGLASL